MLPGPLIPKTLGRPVTRPSLDEVQLVLDEHKREDVGVIRVAVNLKKSHDISYSKVYRIMKENGLVVPSAAKSRRRKWDLVLDLGPFVPRNGISS